VELPAFGQSYGFGLRATYAMQWWQPFPILLYFARDGRDTKCVDGRGQPPVNTEDLVFNQSRQGEVIEHLGAVAPNVDAPAMHWLTPKERG
jgi:hypothetical protein